MPATTDRGDILHLAGRRHLSPALRDGRPVLVEGHDPSAVRCGWEAFFRALSGAGLAVAFTPGAEGPIELVARERAHGDPVHRASLGHAVAHSRRFLAAWRGGAKAA